MSMKLRRPRQRRGIKTLKQRGRIVIIRKKQRPRKGIKTIKQRPETKQIPLPPRRVPIAVAKALKPKPKIRKTGQRFTPIAKQKRLQVKKRKSKIRRTFELAKQRKVDVRDVTERGFNIFAPRGTSPAFTVEGQKFVENPDTPPANIGQLQIRAGQAVAQREQRLPRQKIDKFTEDVSSAVFGGIKSTFKAIDAISLQNVERKKELKKQGLLPAQQKVKQPPRITKTVAAPSGLLPTFLPEEVARTQIPTPIEIFTVPELREKAIDVGKTLARGGIATAQTFVLGVSGLGAASRILGIASGVREQERQKEREKQETLTGTGGLFGIGDVTPKEQRGLRTDEPKAQLLPPAQFGGEFTTGRRRPEDFGDIFEPDFFGGARDLPTAVPQPEDRLGKKGKF